MFPKDEILKGAKLSVEQTIVNPLLNINQLKIEEIQNFNLNVKIIRFLQILGGYNKLKIICNLKNCFIGCRSARSHQVIGINERGEEHLLMTASQEALQCDSYGYMLVYKSNDVIFGTLGYQFNQINNCNCCCCDCSCCDCSCCDCSCCGGGCCGGCCKCESKKEKCCCEELCTGCCDCCKDCCQNGGCFKGGCCIGGCCCCWEDGCCVGGCCTFCNCCCFAGGCCNEPCCEKGCCSCPDFQNILLDVRFLNTMEEALTKEAGLYVSTLYSPITICGCGPSYIGYKKCGERFALEQKCCKCISADLPIMDLVKKEQVGNAHQNSCVESYDVDLPKDAFPLEKLLIVSEIFMLVFLNWDEKEKDQMVLKIFPGLNPDFC